MRSKLAVLLAVAAVSALTVPALAQDAGDDLPGAGMLDLGSTGADASYIGERDSRAGWAIAPAGDLNADGRADALIGAPGASPDLRTRAGSVFVLFGEAKGGPLTVRLNALDERGFRIDGAVVEDELGIAVASAGDVNRDGTPDLLVGAPGANEDRGAVYVIYGKATTERVDLAALQPAQGYRIAGELPGGMFGVAVANAGDQNGDGVPDQLVGAPKSAPNGRADAGAAYVVYGRASDLDLAARTPADGFRLDGPRGGLAGLAVATLPDLDGDAVSELAVGAPATDPDAVDDAVTAQPADKPLSGAVHVVSGGARPADVDLRTQGGRIRGGQDALGVTAETLGDLNGDSYAELGVGAPLTDVDKKRDNGGRVYVLWGARALLNGTLDVRTLKNDRGIAIDSRSANELLGTGIDTPGDVDGDGEADLLVTAGTSNRFSRLNTGAAYLIPGPVAKDVDLKTFDPPKDGLVLVGSTNNGTLREAVGVGDLDGDGAPDVLAGEQGAEATTTGEDLATFGAARLVRGTKPAPPPPKPDKNDPGIKEEKKAGCIAATSVELIFDDSGSMADTDPLNLRAKAAQLLLAKPSSVGRRFGAVAFGSEADQLFERQLIRPQGPEDRQVDELSAIFDRNLRSERGGTNYNAGFRLANSLEGRASARIFLTDGEHNEGRYRNLHRGGPPTFVIGLSIGNKGAIAARLRKIARETDAKYFPRVKDDTVQAVVNAIDSILNCDVDMDQFIDQLTKGDDEADPNEVDLDDDAHSADVNLSWDDPEADVQAEDIEVVGDDGTVVASFDDAELRAAVAGTASPAKGNVKVTGTRGASFLSLRVSGLGGAAKLRVKVAGDSLRQGTKVRTQVAQSRRRR